jgi:LysR family transcriptional regulator, transcriptional activator of nhaA
VDVEQLNLHHLRYFWAVARAGNLTQTAARLRVAQSALSSQIRQLEAQVGHALFRREGRGLALTEAGEIALAHADTIFRVGTELLDTLERGRRRDEVLRLGAVATLSRNFQESLIRPLLGQAGTRLRLESGAFDDLLDRLEAHALDVVLTNRPPPRTRAPVLRCRRLARQPVSIVGARRRRHFTFPDDIVDREMILPGPASEVRTAFDALCEQLGVTVRIHAEVDDMAMLRLLARDADRLALVPSVVVRDELGARTLHEYGVVPGLVETFYAVTVERTFQHPLLAELLAREEQELLAVPASSSSLSSSSRRAPR